MQDAVACFGELLLRLTPEGHGNLRSADTLSVHVGGAEANVAIGLANLGHDTRIVSAIPGNELGRRALLTLKLHGVETAHVTQGSGRMGLYFFTPAAGTRQGKVLYDREGSVFATRAANDYDFDAALEGCCHLHLSGVSLALSSAAASSARTIVEVAKARGLTVSFDGNYRSALWQRTKRNPRPLIAGILLHADLFFGNHKDISLLLDQEFSGEGPERRRQAAEAAFHAFQNLTLIASTARHVHDGALHSIVGRIDTPATSFQSAEQRLSNIIDRIGTGDAFAAGLLHSWLGDPEALERALESGVALASLKHFTPGDFSVADRDELEASLQGNGDVSR